MADRYAGQPRLAEIMRLTADRWRQGCLDLADTNGLPDFNRLSFDFRTRQPVGPGKWREPDAAAGVARLEYAAWMRFGNSNYLHAAESCVRFLQSRGANYPRHAQAEGHGLTLSTRSGNTGSCPGCRRS